MENIGDMLFGAPPAPKEGEEAVKQKPIKVRSLREIRGASREPSIVLGAEITSGLKRRNKAFASLRARQMKSTMDMYGDGKPMYKTTARGSSREALYNAVEWVESGGKSNAVSPKGAIGPMQTMPHTLRDPGYGVVPARNNSVHELRRVGRDYLDAMTSKYGPIGGLAAYNWGPGNWERALKNAGGNVDKALRSAPKETRDYVPKVMGQLNRR